MNLVLDVWENEPDVLLPLLPHLMLATPHIAGHTLEGKARGTEMLYQQLCLRLNRQPSMTLSDLMPEAQPSYLELSEGPLAMDQIRELIWQIYDIRNDDATFRAKVNGPESFVYSRKHYAIRREFAATRVNAGNCALSEAIYRLGFKKAQ